MSGTILVHLFNNGDFSLICCSQNFSSTSCPETMAKRIQEEKGEGRIVAKSKPTLKLVSHAATSSSTVQSPIASKSLGTLRAPCHPDWKRTGKLVAREHNQDAASCSQVWQKDAEMDKSTRRLAASGISDIDGKGTPWPQSAYIYRLRFTSWESSLECATEIRSQTGRHNGRSRFCGECSCPLLFKLTFILGTIVPRIYIPSKISPSEH